ncbi:MAG: bifunctional aspartate kinase/homoserine dehydrogenase I, partial [Myxococcota bacterium]
MEHERYRVLKFGGSSVGDPDRLVRIIDTIREERAAGPIAVVVSAMGKSTDMLIEAARAAASGDLEHAQKIVDRVETLATTNSMLVLRGVDTERAASVLGEITGLVRELTEPLRKVLIGVHILRENSLQSLDMIMSFGERLSATVVAELLSAHGVPALFLDARTWTRTDDTFSQALVQWPATQALLTELERTWGGRIPVCTGFLGSTADGRTTTLGRNGSDYTATLLARALGAQEVVISTDVAGVMTADPGIVTDAYPVAQLSYLEALELANYGAKMFHPRTMLPLIESGIPMCIRNTMRPGDLGTRISASHTGDGEGPICVTSLENLALIDVRWRQLSQQALMGKRVLGALERERITVWMATQAAHGQAVAVAVPAGALERAERAIREEMELEFERHEVEGLRVQSPVTLLSLVAEKMSESTDVAGRFFHAMGQVGVTVRAIAQGESSRSISCVIPAEDTDIAVRTVHSAFNFAHQQVNVMLLGKGIVGSQFIEQINTQREELLAAHDVDLRVVGLADSRAVVFDEMGLRVEDVDGLLSRDGVSANSREHMEGALGRLKRLPVPVLVDCTAADGMEEVYEGAFAHGVHVVAANKKPLTVAQARRNALMNAARRHYRAYLYETTVGASLPVIETLKNLVRTGDTVLRIEGAFSGTLGYLTNEVMDGVSLSQAVSKARELGYTEPRPQDDLSGLDVARKALILARELGLELELEDISVEPLVPESIIATDTLDEFFDALGANDAAFTAMIEDMKAKQLTLRYLAVIDPGGPARPVRVRVGPMGIEPAHPATRLRGSEGFVAFTTARYQDYPLIVQ